MISVIIPTYNYGRLISKAIGSVMSQSYTNYEIIVIDDGSEDDTGTVIREITSSHSIDAIKYIRTENRGIGAAKTLGVRQSTGDYLLFMDADDYMDSRCLESLVLRTDDGRVDWVIGSFRFVDEYGNTIKEEKAFERDEVTKWCYTYIHANLFKRQVFIDRGVKLETNFTTDVETAFQFCVFAGDIAYSNEIQYNYLVHNSTTRDSNKLYDYVMAGDSRCNLSELFGSVMRNVQPFLDRQDYNKLEYGLIRFYYSKILVTVQNYSYKEAKNIYSVFNRDFVYYCPDYLNNEYIFKVLTGMTRVRKLVTPVCALLEITRLFSLFLLIYTRLTRGRRIVD